MTGVYAPKTSVVAESCSAGNGAGVAIRIGSIIASLQAQRRLAESSFVLSKTYERLSTGQRINKASDDAAGLAIADSLKANGSLYTMAQRNINDALSASNIMSSALEQQQQIFNRLSELAEQSANGVYTDQQRTALSKEYRALVSEINRVSATTSFNGIKLLANKRDGNQTDLAMQAGIAGDADSRIVFGGADTGFLSGAIGLLLSTNEAARQYLAPADLTALRDALSSANPLDSVSALCGGAVAATSVKDTAGAERDIYTAVLWGFSTSSKNSYTLMTFAFAQDSSGAFGEVDFDTYIFSLQDTPNVKRSLSLTFADSGTTAQLTLDYTPLTMSQSYKGAVAKSALDFTGVETVSRAKDALTTIGNRRAEISLIQSQVGALQSRFGAAFEVASSSGINARAAESRIRDADVTEESGVLVRVQISQQAAAAVLAQANQQPAMALQLLRAV